MSEELQTGKEAFRVDFSPSAIKEVAPTDYAKRFAMGAAIAVVAGILGTRYGAKFGGLFLAFPAILPASLTLIEKKEGTRSADVDAMGAVLGAIGMVAFAITATRTLQSLPPPVALVIAAGAWVLTSAALYFGAVWVRRKRRG